MMRQRHKRILMIGMVLLLLFSTLTGCNGREEATTPAATTPAVTTPAPPTEAELKRQQLLDLWQKVVVDQTAEVGIEYKTYGFSSILSAPPTQHDIPDPENIQAILDYLKGLNPTFTQIRSLEPGSYILVYWYQLYNKAITENKTYFFSFSLSADGVLSIYDPTWQWKLETDPGSVNSSEIMSILSQYH